MAIHTKVIEEKDFYLYWQGYKTAIVLNHDVKYKQWDTFILQCDTPKWKDLPIYYKISFIDTRVNGILLHLKP